MVKYLTQHMVYGFISCTSDIFYLCQKKKTLCTYMWRHENVKAQRLDHVATRLPLDVKISHTRAKHVKYNPPKWLQLLGS